MLLLFNKTAIVPWNDLGKDGEGNLKFQFQKVCEVNYDFVDDLCTSGASRQRNSFCLPLDLCRQKEFLRAGPHHSHFWDLFYKQRPLACE